MAKIKCTMYPVNVNHGTVGGVKTDYRVIVMGVVRGGIYLFIFLIYYLVIYSFICLFGV